MNIIAIVTLHSKLKIAAIEQQDTFLPMGQELTDLYTNTIGKDPNIQKLINLAAEAQQDTVDQLTTALTNLASKEDIEEMALMVGLNSVLGDNMNVKAVTIYRMMQDRMKDKNFSLEHQAVVVFLLVQFMALGLVMNKEEAEDQDKD